MDYFPCFPKLIVKVIRKINNMQEEKEKPSVFELVEKRNSLKGHKIISKTKELGVINYIFYQNYNDLGKLITYYESDFSIWNIKNRDKLKQLGFEAIRLLHNLAASATTLIDHTRNFTTELNNEELTKWYEENLNKLMENEVIKFMKDFRNYFLHHQLPLLNETLNITRGRPEGEVHQKLEIDKKELLKWGKWSSQSKQFLNKAGDKIDLKEFCREYHDLIKKFYEEFYGKVGSTHETEIKELMKFEKEMVEMYPELNKEKKEI